MIDLKQKPVIEESLLEELNKFIDNVIKEKKYVKFNYEGLEMILAQMLDKQNIKPINSTEVDLTFPIKKDEVIKLCFDFFESIDPVIAKKAKLVFLNQLDDIKTNMYDVDEVKDFNKYDENGILEYTKDGSVHTRFGKTIVHLPTGRLSSVKEKKITQKECTLCDVYWTVHEIAHTFDLVHDESIPQIISSEDEINSPYKFQRNGAREMLVETTAIIFEKLLTDYLLTNTQYPKAAIQQVANRRERIFYLMSRDSYSKLILSKIKEEKGIIDEQEIRKIMEQYDLTPNTIQQLALDMIDNSQSISWQRKYILASLFSPTIFMEYKKNPEKGKLLIKEYIYQVKNDRFDGALEVFGIKMSDKGLNKLIKNKNKYQTEINNLGKDIVR